MGIEMEDCLMTAVVELVDGEYVLKVRVPTRSINEWTLGKDEAIAKGKASNILSSYTNGLEFVQEQVRNVFSEEEERAKE